MFNLGQELLKVFGRIGIEVAT